MKISNRLIAIATILSVPLAATAQSAALQVFQMRQLQLERTMAMLNAHSLALAKRGENAEPGEVEGQIREVKSNSDGSITAKTNHGKAVTYNPQVYRPVYVQQRDRTLFGLIPDRTISTGAFWTRAPGESGFRTSVSYADLPYGKLPNPDAKNSTTLCLSQSASWPESGGAADSYGLNLTHQINSDLELLQYTGNFGINTDQGAPRQMTGGVTVGRTVTSSFAATVTGSYYNGEADSNGWTAQADLSYTVTPKLIVYLDGAPPSSVKGLSPWDIGAQATLCPNLSFSLEFDQGQIWFMGLTGRFNAR
jgi:hypothetical protein